MIQKYTLLFLFVGTLFNFQAQVTILDQDFQAGIPANWLLIDVDQQIPNAAVSEYTQAWIMKADPENPTDSVVSSTSFYEPEGRADKWLITEAITLGAYGNEIRWNAKAHDPAYADGYKVLISSTGTNVEDFTDTVALILSENSEWEARKENLSALGYNSQTVYIAFVNNTNQGYKLYLDDIQVSKDDPAATSNINKVEANVYPNPFQDEIFIKTAEKIKRILILDLLGKVVFDAKNPSQHSISLAQVEPGSYLLQLETENGTKVMHISKK